MQGEQRVGISLGGQPAGINRGDVKISEISREMAILNENMEQLSVEIKVLEDRITPVLMPIGPQESSGLENKTTSGSPVGGLLKIYNERVRRMVMHVQNMSGRVEL